MSTANGNGNGAEPTALSPETAAELAGFVDQIGDGIVVLDRQWRFRYLSEPAARMVGRSAESLIGRDMWREFPGEHGLSFQLAFEEAFREGVPTEVVDHYEPLDRWFEARAFPRGDELLIVVRDVTEQQRIAAALREDGERLEAAEQIAGFGVWKWDMKGGRLHWSDQLQRIYGYEPEDSNESDGSVEDFLGHAHPDDRARIWAEVERAIFERNPFSFEQRIVRADGEQRLLLSEGQPVVAADGTVEALLGVCHDVTGRTVGTVDTVRAVR